MREFNPYLVEAYAEAGDQIFGTIRAVMGPTLFIGLGVLLGVGVPWLYHHVHVLLSWK